VALAILVLTLAAVNYVNLATIRLIRRQREIAMRKVLGASNGRLALQFGTESLLVSMLATAAGLILACPALPVFSQLMNRDLGSVLSLENVVSALGLGVALGLVTAIYPAWIALGVRSSLMLVGRPDAESPRSKHLRQALSVLQVAAAMGLASFTLAIFWQARFAIDASPGFDPPRYWSSTFLRGSRHETKSPAVSWRSYRNSPVWLALQYLAIRLGARSSYGVPKSSAKGETR
jgi:putative ABC transport system permease protein